MAAGDPSRRVAFLDDIVDIVDGDEAVLTRHAELLRENEAVRDLRDEAAMLCAELALAGDDFEPVDDLAAPRESDAGPASKAKAKAGGTMSRNKGAAGPQGRREAGQGAGRRALPWLMGVLAIAIGAFAAHSLGVLPFAAQDSGTSPKVKMKVPPKPAGLSARIRKIVSGTAAGEAGGGSGLAIEAAGGAKTEGSSGRQVPEASTLRTDALTRAHLALSDETLLTLDRDSSLTLSNAGPRHIELQRGRALIALPRSSGKAAKTPLTVAFIHGTLELSDAELMLRVAEGASLLHVVRGQAVLRSKDGARHELSVGQRARLGGAKAPSVGVEVGLGALLRWADLEPEPVDAEGPAWGLGELRAPVATVVDGGLDGDVGDGGAGGRSQSLLLIEHRATLELGRLFVRTVIEERFENQSDQARAGHYRLRVPSGAVVDRVELALGEDFQRASVAARSHEVEAAPATAASGPVGVLELSIAEIAAGASVRVRVGYSEPLRLTPDGARHIHALGHAGPDDARVGRFELQLRAADLGAGRLQTYGYELEQVEGEKGEGAALRLSEKDFAAHGDLIVEVEHGAAGEPPPASIAVVGRIETDKAGDEAGRKGKRKGEQGSVPSYLALALRPQPLIELPEASPPLLHLLVVDTSRSMVGRAHDRSLALVRALISEFETRDRVEVLACDSLCEGFGDGPWEPSSKQAEEVVNWLQARAAHGASDLGLALESARERLEQANKALPQHRGRVFYIGDGRPSLGSGRIEELSARVQQLSAAGATRLDTIAVDGQAGGSGRSLLAALGRAGGGSAFDHATAHGAKETAIDALLAWRTAPSAQLDVSWPQEPPPLATATVLGLPAGQPLLLLAQLESLQGELLVQSERAGKKVEHRHALAEAAAAASTLRASWVDARSQALEAAAEEEWQSRALELATASGVLSRHVEARFDGALARLAVGSRVDQRRSPFQGDERPLDDAAAGLSRYEQAEAEAAAAGDGPPSRKPLALPGAAPVKGPVRLVAFEPTTTASGAERRAVDDAVRELSGAPGDRARHSAVVRTLSRLGNLERAHDAVEAWLALDDRDPEALALLSDIVGRRGERALALRILGGVIDLLPEDLALQRRLGSALDRAGALDRGCAHHLRSAELEATVEAEGRALSCLRTTGQAEAAGRLLASLAEARRPEVEQAAAERIEAEAKEPELVLQASWRGDHDLDLSLISNRGTRISWMGGRADVTGSGAYEPGVETLSLRRAAPGTYTVEIGRADGIAPEAGALDAIEGKILARIFGVEQNFDFKLEGPRTRVGRIVVTPAK